MRLVSVEVLLQVAINVLFFVIKEVWVGPWLRITRGGNQKWNLGFDIFQSVEHLHKKLRALVFFREMGECFKDSRWVGHIWGAWTPCVICIDTHPGFLVQILNGLQSFKGCHWLIVLRPRQNWHFAIDMIRSRITYLGCFCSRACFWESPFAELFRWIIAWLYLFRLS